MDGGPLSTWINTARKIILVRINISLPYVYFHVDRYVEKYYKMRVLYGQRLKADQEKTAKHYSWTQPTIGPNVWRRYSAMQ